MKNTITLNMENLSEDEREQLMKLVEKANKMRKPENGEQYYIIYSYGGIDLCVWCDTKEDKGRYSIGNCFKSKEETEFAVEKAKVIAELKRFAEENNEREIDWNDWTQYKFSIYCSYLHDDDIQYKESHAHKYGNTVYFTSEKIAKAAVKKIGEDRLKKYYFEVED